MRGGRRQLLEPAASGAFEILPGRQLVAATRIDPVVPVQRRAADVVESADDVDPLPFELLPNLLDPVVPTGITRRQLVAGEVLWQALAASPHNWRRSITLDGELMSFYCAPARVALEILDEDADAFGATELDRTGTDLRKVPIPISDVEQRCATIVGWLDTLCASRILSHTHERSAGWLRRRRGPADQTQAYGASAS
jgi:hypothetical protein